MRHALRVWAVLAVVAGIALLVALGSGSALVDPLSVPRLLFAPDGSDAAEVLHTLRLPRALSAFATGGLLALAGALMQVLLRNPLADPYVLGISGGAAAGALAAMAAGLAAIFVQLGAFAGALLTIVLVFAIAHRDLARVAAAGTLDTAPRLLLTGVMLAAGWTALITLMLAMAPEARLRGMLFWLAVLLSFKLGDALGSPMIKPMLVDQGWSNAELGQLTLISSLAGIAGAFLGGLLYARIGALRALLLFGLLQAGGIAAMALLVNAGSSTGWVYLVALFEQTADGMSTVALFAVMMRQCRPEHEGADFTLQASVQLLLAGLVGATSGWLAEQLGFATLFVSAGVLGLLALPIVLLYFWRGARPAASAA